MNAPFSQPPTAAPDLALSEPAVLTAGPRFAISNAA